MDNITKASLGLVVIYIVGDAGHIIADAANTKRDQTVITVASSAPASFLSHTILGE